MKANRLRVSNLLECLLVITLLLLPACKGDKGDESATKVSAPEVTDEPDTAVEDAPEEEPFDTETSGESIPSLKEIRLIKIKMLSDSPRDGFEAEVEFSSGSGGDTNLIYDWKHNGDDITGAHDPKLEWREGFKKGDTITLSVTPYSDLGEGAASAVGSFTIPNSPPVITSQPGTSFEEGRFSYIVQAEDPDGDSMDFSLRNAPKGMTIEPAAGLILWEYGEKDAGDYKVTVIVTDSEGAQSEQELTLSIHPPESASEGAE